MRTKLQRLKKYQKLKQKCRVSEKVQLKKSQNILKIKSRKEDDNLNNCTRLKSLFRRRLKMSGVIWIEMFMMTSSNTVSIERSVICMTYHYHLIIECGELLTFSHRCIEPFSPPKKKKKNSRSRREPIVINRARIGHFRLTHFYLITKEPGQSCDILHEKNVELCKNKQKKIVCLSKIAIPLTIVVTRFFGFNNIILKSTWIFLFVIFIPRRKITFGDVLSSGQSNRISTPSYR
ncbi:hypothetical protein AGLY_012548 [Aphis glycines]|uniref:Uncharacterized protein n=1 Tax=Aphis glycines TaxID=307491 RepID=A0A6G0T9J6_APHGL|nr:hypothetical protein AGLY_012548 [Aphis glycines]